MYNGTNCKTSIDEYLLFYYENDGVIFYFWSLRKKELCLGYGRTLLYRYKDRYFFRLIIFKVMNTSAKQASITKSTTMSRKA